MTTQIFQHTLVQENLLNQIGDPTAASSGGDGSVRQGPARKLPRSDPSNVIVDVVWIGVQGLGFGFRAQGLGFGV